ncbi:hypothetical protein ACW5R3_00680 [Bizionia sp. KMM 8389]
MIFKETQKFTQWWLWLILIPLAILPFYGLIKQLVYKTPFGDKPMSDLGLILFAFFMCAFLYFFWVLRLETTINKQGIVLHYFPFIKKETPWSDIKDLAVITYGFVGYGIRWGSIHGTVYNVKGQKGLLVTLKNGDSYVIGTQKESELKGILEKQTLI